MSIYKNHLGQNASSGPLWVTATYYNIGDLITYQSVSYICLTAHTSGTFATDYGTNNYWVMTGPGLNPTMSMLMPAFPQNRTIVVKNTAFGGSTPSAGGSTPSNTPSTPTSAIIAPAGTPTAPTLGGVTPSAAGSTPGYTGGATITDLATPKITFNQLTSFPPPVTTGTIAMQQGTATPVVNGTFDVPSSNLSTGTNNFQTKATSGSPGTSGNTLLSNVVPVTASVISNTQVTNLQNNQYIPDVIITVGSPANTSSTPKFFIFNSALYFIGTNDPNVSSSKLYKCTTSNVVTQASNINTNGPDFTYDWNPILFNSQMYFTSNDTTGTFNQIQRMDTSGNINSVTSSNINVAAGGYDENSLFIFNSKLYFIGSERTNTLTTGGNKLWAIDTSNNVTLVTNLNAGANDFNTGIGMPFQPIIFNTAMYFPALNGSYYNLYSLTTSGTLTQVANTTNNPTNTWGMWNTSNAGLTPLWSPVILGSNLYFIANNAVGNGIYKIFACSTSNVVTQVSNTTNSNYGSDFYQTNAYTLDIFGEKPLLVAFNSAIYFAANNSNDMSKLYKLTNTTTITQISNLTGSQSVTDAIYSGMFVFNSQLFFVGSPFVRGNGTPVVKTYSLSTSDVISLAFNSADAIDGPAIFSSFGSPSATGGGLLPWIGIANGSTNFYVVAPCAEVPADGTTLSPNGSHNPNPLPLSLSTQFLGCALYSYSSSGVLTRVSATTHPGGGTYTPEVFPWQVHYINNAPCVYFNSTLYFWGYNQYGALKLFRL